MPYTSRVVASGFSRTFGAQVLDSTSEPTGRPVARVSPL
jgi:hypothetical protein